MQVIAALKGDLRRDMAVELAATSSGIRRATDKTSRKLQLAARAEINARFRGSGRVAGGNRRVANAVRRKLYFDDGPFKARALIFSKFGRRGPGGFIDYLAPFVLGATIRPRQAKFLRIPFRATRAGRRQLRAALARLGQPRSNVAVIPTKNPGVFVVVRQFRNRSTLIGWLVRRVVIRPKISFASAHRQADRDYPRALVEEIEGAAKRGGRRSR